MPGHDACCEEGELWGFGRLQRVRETLYDEEILSRSCKKEPGVFAQQPGPGWLELSG